MDPFKPERVAEILRLVTIGNDLSEEERLKVRHLISVFADIIALSVHEVHTVEGATHRLNIPPNATFTKRVHQKPLTPPQQQYLYKSIDTTLSALHQNQSRTPVSTLKEGGTFSIKECHSD